MNDLHYLEGLAEPTRRSFILNLIDGDSGLSGLGGIFGSGGSSPPPPSDSILLEDGTDLLLEDWTAYLLE